MDETTAVLPKENKHTVSSLDLVPTRKNLSLNVQADLRHGQSLNLRSNGRRTKPSIPKRAVKAIRKWDKTTSKE